MDKLFTFIKYTYIHQWQWTNTSACNRMDESQAQYCVNKARHKIVK